MTYREAGERGTVAGIDYETVQLDHGTSGCTGYRLRIGGRLLAYSGDSIATPPLDRLVRAEITRSSATSARILSHLSWEEAHALRDRHPDTRFLFVHLYEGTLDGAVSDLQVVDV